MNHSFFSLPLLRTLAFILLSCLSSRGQEVDFPPSYNIPAPVNAGNNGGDQLGRSVAASGTLVAVGVPDDDLGHGGTVKVFDVVTGKLEHVLPNPLPSARSFGQSVAMSGTRVAVGAPNADFGVGNAGCVFVFDLASATPTDPVIILYSPEPLQDNYFGSALAISGTKVVVGVNQYEQKTDNDEGIAYVYDLAAAAPEVPVLTLLNPKPSVFDYYGTAVGISGSTVAIGAPLEGKGTVYVYKLDGANPGTPVQTLTNPTPAMDDRFGNALAVAGTRILVGDEADDAGAMDAGRAYVYDLASTTPTVPVTVLANPAPDNGDNFGRTVSISGNWALIAVPGYALRSGDYN
jgi:hypothetical protein